MSVPVALTELAARMAEFGSVSFLVTVGDVGPHVVSVAVEWRDDVLVVGAGRRTAANVASRPVVTLLWPPAGGDYSLIVDGAAQLEGESLVITPTAAVMHRTAGADASIPSCITVLPTTSV